MADVLEGYRVLCRKDELPVRGKKVKTVNGIRVLIIVCDDNLSAIEDKCPQTGRTMSHGEVLDHVIVSPYTGARYDLRTGKYVEGGQSPFQSHWLAVLHLRVVENEVMVRV